MTSLSLGAAVKLILGGEGERKVIPGEENVGILTLDWISFLPHLVKILQLEQLHDG